MNHSRKFQWRFRCSRTKLSLSLSKQHHMKAPGGSLNRIVTRPDFKHTIFLIYQEEPSWTSQLIVTSWSCHLLVSIQNDSEQWFPDIILLAESVVLCSSSVKPWDVCFCMKFFIWMLVFKKQNCNTLAEQIQQNRMTLRDLSKDYTNISASLSELLFPP